MTHALDRPDLELGYRRLLRRYPAAYRAQREEEILATLMEAAQPGRDRPTMRERLDLTLGALRTQLRMSLRPTIEAGAAAVALPAALLLVGMLAASLLGIIAAAVMHLSGLPHFGQAISRDQLVTVVMSGLPRVLAATALGAALLARKPALARGIAAIICLAYLLALTANFPLEPSRTQAVMHGLLALLVAAAPSEALRTTPRRALALTLALVLAPLLVQGAITVRVVQWAAHTDVPPAQTWDGSIGAIAELLIGVIVTAVLLRRWRTPGAAMAVALITTAMAGPLVLLSTVAMQGYSSAADVTAHALSAAVVIGYTAAAVASRTLARRSAAATRRARA